MNGRRANSGRVGSGFSLIELVIVVVIIGIIGAIAIPRMSRGAAGASDGALKANLAVLRNALDLYYAEHKNTYPTLAAMQAESTTDGGPGHPLLDYTDENGTAGLRDVATGRIFGPYLRSIPPLPVGVNKGETGFTATQGDPGAGWYYEASTGEIRANCIATELDDKGVAWASY